MQRTALSLLIAFLGYSLLNIAQAGQKIGLALRERSRTRGWLLWFGATAATSVAFFVILGAISVGSVSLVGAMMGTGLASLAVFSHFVMDERLGAPQVAAVAVVIAGAVLVGVSARTESGVAQVNTALLWGILAGGALLYPATWLVIRKSPSVGALVGSFSGFLGAYSQLFQEYGTKSATAGHGVGPFVLSLITDPVTLVWIGLSVVSMVVLQFSYKHGKAMQIIPAFTGTCIVVPA